MSPRTQMLIPIVVVAAFLGITTMLLLGGDDGDRAGSAQTIADPLAEALWVLPSEAAMVAVVETDVAAGPLAAGVELARRVPAAAAAVTQLNELLGIDLGLELMPLLGNPLVVGIAAAPTPAPADPGALVPALRLATVARDQAGLRDLVERQVASAAITRGVDVRGFTTYVREAGGALALQGALLVAAGTEEELRAALALHERARRGEGPAGDDLTGALTARDLRSRFRGLPGAAASVVRVSADAALLALVPEEERDRVAWVDALQRVAFAVVPDADEGISVPFRLQTDPEGLTDGDVPIASGVTPPSPAAPDDAPVVLAFRDFAHTIDFVRRALPSTYPELAGQISEIENALRRFARVDPTSQIVAKLTETTTITVDEEGRFTMRSDLNDPEELADALSRVQNISRLGSLAGGFGIDVDTGGITVEDDGEDRYRILRDGDLLVRIGVVFGTLVLTDDEDVDLEEISDAIPSGADREDRGAFSARVDPDVLADALVERLGLPRVARLALGPVGGLTVSARGGVTGISGTLRIALGED